MKQQFIWMIGARAYGSLVQAIVTVVLARLIGPAEFGALGLALGVSMFLLVIADFGVSTLIAKARALGDDGLVISLLKFNAWTSVGAALALAASAIVAGASNPSYLPLTFVVIALALEKNVDTGLGVAIADGDKIKPNVSVVIRRSLTLVLFLLMIALGIDALASYGVASLFGAIAGQVHMGLVLRSSLRAQSGAFRFYEVLHKTFPFFLSNIAAQSKSLDVVIIGAVAGVPAAGLYTAAIRLTNPFYLLPQALTALILPHAARNGPAYARRLGHLVALGALALLAGLAPLMLYSKQLAVLVLGTEYASASVLLTLSLGALPFVSLSSILGALLQSQGNQRFVAINGLFFAVLLLGAMWLGAVVQGAAGTAAALIIIFAAKSTILWGRLAFGRPDSLAPGS